MSFHWVATSAPASAAPSPNTALRITTFSLLPSWSSSTVPPVPMKPEVASGRVQTALTALVGARAGSPSHLRVVDADSDLRRDYLQSMASLLRQGSSTVLAAWCSSPISRESACRPGSVTAPPVTCGHSPAMPLELLFYLSWLLISFGFFPASGGTETELADQNDGVIDVGDVLVLVGLYAPLPDCQAIKATGR